VGVFLLCLVEGETQKVIEEFHRGVCGGHYSWKTTAHKILKTGLYWPTLFGSVHLQVRSRQKCQVFAETQKLSPLPCADPYIVQSVEIHMKQILRNIAYQLLLSCLHSALCAMEYDAM